MLLRAARSPAVGEPESDMGRFVKRDARGSAVLLAKPTDAPHRHDEHAPIANREMRGAFDAILPERRRVTLDVGEDFCKEAQVE